MLTIDSNRETMHTLRLATAVAVCLVCAERFHLDEPGLAVWSTYMVMVQFAYSTFQKGVERILGRSLGIVLALVLATLTRNATGLGFVLELLAVVPLFYVYFSNRLAYTFLNAGLYLAVVMQTGRSDPSNLLTYAGGLFVAIVLGVIVADLVTWLSGVERDVTIHAEGQPLFPLDGARLEHSVMLMLTVATAQIASHYLHLSSSTALVSVMLLTITPDFQSLLRKGKLRLAGAVLAILFALCALTVLTRIPSFVLLVSLMFVGTFLAGALARQSAAWGYAGVQMGLVLPMILIVPHHEFGTIWTALARVAGALIAIGSSIFVGFVWAAVAPTAPLPFDPATPIEGRRVPPVDQTN